MLVLLSNSIQYFPLISVQYFPLSQLFENDFTEVETIGRGMHPWIPKAVTACHSGLCVGKKPRHHAVRVAPTGFNYIQELRG